MGIISSSSFSVSFAAGRKALCDRLVFINTFARQRVRGGDPGPGLPPSFPFGIWVMRLTELSGSPSRTVHVWRVEENATSTVSWTYTARPSSLAVLTVPYRRGCVPSVVDVIAHRRLHLGVDYFLCGRVSFLIPPRCTLQRHLSSSKWIQVSTTEGVGWCPLLVTLSSKSSPDLRGSRVGITLAETV